MLWQLLLIVTAIWTLFYLIQRRRIYKVEKEIPSCNLRSWPLLGHALQLAGSNEDRMNALKEFSNISIKNGGMTTVWLVNKLYVVVTDPLIAEVIMKNCIDKDDFLIRHLQTLHGNGSIFAQVNIWRPRRKIMAPIFSLKNLNAFVPIFVSYSKIMVEQLELKAGKGDFSIWDYTNAYTFDSVCKTALGKDLNSLLTRNHPYCEATIKVFTLIAHRMCKPWLYLDSVYKLFPEYKTFVTNRQVMIDFIEEVITRKRLAEQDLNKAKKNTDTGEMQTFIELLMESSGTQKRYTNLELREEIMVIITAGTDTSAVGASFATVMLSRYPDVQEKVFQELKEVFGDTDRPLSVEDLPRLKYLEAVIKETMRLYPAVPIILREVHNDVELRGQTPEHYLPVPAKGKLVDKVRNLLYISGTKRRSNPTSTDSTDTDSITNNRASGTTLVKDVKIFMSIWGLHRNPTYWGEDAELFRPERFLEGPLKHPAQFIPFSLSLRSCLGSKFAMMSMQILLSTLLRRYRILPPSGLDPQRWTAPLRVQFEIMMKHVDNYVIRIEKRQ